MYTGSLAPVSNREDWQDAYQLWDTEEDEFIDITGCVVTITVRNKDTQETCLTGSSDDGDVTFPEDGVFEWLFSADDMSALCAGTYEVGVRIANDERTVQLIIGSVQVLDGIDEQ